MNVSHTHRIWRLLLGASSISVGAGCCLSLVPRAQASTRAFDYDLLVLGGGSGGLACAKEAADLGASVAVLDFVEPTSKGTKWGLGGTCVNVGCIPKKLMHLSALVGESVRSCHSSGWHIDNNSVKFDWAVLQENISNHIKSLNFGHRSQLMSKHVDYINMRGKFVDNHTVHCEETVKQKARTISSDKIVISVGMRPKYPNIAGVVEHAITSDDLFWLTDAPNKTLVIGGSYVALESAGFLQSMGFRTSVMVRSTCLRGFDRQMANLVTDFMEKDTGVTFLWHCMPKSIKKLATGKLEVVWENTDSVSQHSEEFDTVLVATGRRPLTSNLNLEAIGVHLSQTGHVIGGSGGITERSSVENIFAIGDVLSDGVELTPVAVQAGKRLARRLFKKDCSPSECTMTYKFVPTTVFTPLEYSCVGLSEEEAVTKHGEDGIEVYHAFYTPYEFIIPARDADQCYIKLVCSADDKVIGLHISGPNAGEIMQGFAAAIKMGARKKQLTDDVVGIHPTSAEEVSKLWISKRSGISPKTTGC